MVNSVVGFKGMQKVCGDMVMRVIDGKRFVAFFDLLGFASWVESSGSMEVFRYVKGFLNLMIRSSMPYSVVHPDMSVDVAQVDIGYINFSDSIVFFTRDDSIECLRSILLVCAEFMNVVICGPSRLLRGALAYGDFYAEPDSNAYVGQALIDAYRLEEKQDWLSVSIHSSVECLPQFSWVQENMPGLIVPSDIPLRGEPEAPLCINWAERTYLQATFNVRRGVLDCYKRGLAAVKGNHAERNKLKRRVRLTKEFLIRNNSWKLVERVEENAKN